MNYKTIVSLAVLIGALSVGYYYVIFLPDFNNEKILLDKQKLAGQFQNEQEQKCIQIVNNERIKQTEEKKAGEYLGELKSKYDKNFDQCLVYFKQLDNCPDPKSQNCRTYETIRNLFTNEVIAEFSYRPSDFSYPNTASSYNEFTNKVKQIFGEQDNSGVNIIDQTNICLDIFEKKKRRYFNDELGQHGVIFNKELNTCLVFNIYNNFATGQYYALVIDMINDKSLLFYNDTPRGPFFDENGQQINCVHRYVSFSYLEGGNEKKEYGCEKYELLDKMFEKIKSYGFEVFTAK